MGGGYRRPHWSDPLGPPPLRIFGHLTDKLSTTLRSKPGPQFVASLDRLGTRYAHTPYSPYREHALR